MYQRALAPVPLCLRCVATNFCVQAAGMVRIFKDCGMDRAPSPGIYKNMRIIWIKIWPGTWNKYDLSKTKACKLNNKYKRILLLWVALGSSYFPVAGSYFSTWGRLTEGLGQPSSEHPSLFKDCGIDRALMARHTQKYGNNMDQNMTRNMKQIWFEQKKLANSITNIK